MDFHTLYNPPPQVPAPVGGESLTQTQFADDCDINMMIARLNQGDTSVLRGAGQYLDLAALPDDLQSALQTQIDARAIWDSHPKIAERFGSIPAFLDFLSDANNRVEAQKLGIIEAVSNVKAAKVAANPVVTPAGAGAEKTSLSSEPVVPTNT